MEELIQQFPAIWRARSPGRPTGLRQTARWALPNIAICPNLQGRSGFNRDCCHVKAGIAAEAAPTAGRKNFSDVRQCLASRRILSPSKRPVGVSDCRGQLPTDGRLRSGPQDAAPDQPRKAVATTETGAWGAPFFALHFLGGQKMQLALGDEVWQELPSLQCAKLIPPSLLSVDPRHTLY